MIDKTDGNEDESVRCDDDATLDQALRDAVEEVTVDDALRARTMAAIRQLRQEEQEQALPLPTQGKDTAASESRSKSVRRKPHSHATRIVAGLVAACLCLSLLGVGGVVVYGTETAYASVTAQTSVGFGVNRFGRVVSVSADEASVQDAVDGLGLVGMDYGEALSALVASGVLGDSEVDVTVEAKGNSQQQQSLVDSSESSLESAGCSGTCNGNRYGSGLGDGSGSGSGSSGGAGSGSGNGSDAGSGNGNGNGNTGKHQVKRDA